ncbi:DUF4435 domain-containing protein [Flavobacterium limnophilum]|uniref:DUF4435 domain-containing protein n=1 Tax=Flavobacterium limnophilum TaxID=3003262 RepID=UPI002482C361|nr:DUF4435 domain-containing protein [Flavobacterium limnophilum]
MITIEESFPRKRANYLKGQDVVWSQFNDVNFYVEDLYQENFYLQILKNLFPNIKISKIFPLGGKDPVIKKAKRSLKNKKKVFILDLDFDEILNKKELCDNIFYLEKYSIENYLVDKNAIIELVKEENPKIKTSEVNQKFDLKLFYNECFNILSELSSNLLLIQKYELGIDYLKIEPHRDCNLNPICLKESVVTPFYQKIEARLKEKKPRLKYSAQINKLKVHFKDVYKGLIYVPGKYILNILNIKLKKIFKFSQSNLSTFIYRLAKNCEFKELEYLKISINEYTK